jgi:AraC-like DNA-binding protein
LTFKTIREDFLKETAVRYLQEPERRIEQISEQLGFSNSGAFRRAFVRWYGYSPSEFRRMEVNRSSRYR